MSPEQSNGKSLAKVYLAQTAAFLWELFKVAAISLAIIIPVRYFLIQPFYVKGQSMEPNFFTYEYLIIDEISYRFNDPSRLDVVVLRDPSDRSQFFIKRIIGLPGETVEIHEGEVIVNGEVLDESEYLDEIATTAFGEISFTLGDEEYFVMGDNRPASFDSRRFGPVTGDEFIGRVWIRAWPFNRWTVFQ